MKLKKIEDLKVSTAIILQTIIRCLCAKKYLNNLKENYVKNNYMRTLDKLKTLKQSDASDRLHEAYKLDNWIKAFNIMINWK